MNPATVLLS